jgi:hypothetical protein
MVARDPDDRALIARIAAHTRWSQEVDRTKATEKARQAALDRFEKQVDPDNTLDPVERARRAESARRAYFTELARKSRTARKRKD